MEADRWEIGSEFEWLPIDDGLILPWPEPHLRFALAQDALIAIVRECLGSDRTLWMPDYFCPPVVDVVRSAGIPVAAYADDPRWPHARWNTLRPRSGDVVLIVNYFGVRDGSAWRDWQAAHRAVTAVEDHTHDPMSTWARTSNAGFAIASLRKTMPIPDGAIAWSPAGRRLPERPHGTDLHGSSLKLAAMALKSLYLAGGAPSKELYRRLQLDGEAALLATRDLPMAPWSEAMLGSGIPSSWRVRREANVRQFVTMVADRPDFRPVFDSWPNGHCPFNAILVFRDSPARDEARKRLVDHDVYASVHWPSAGAGARVRDLSERILTIPIDHRYGSADVGRVAALLSSPGRRPETATRQRGARQVAPTSRLLEPSDPAWDEVLSRMPHDIYHTSAFHRVAEDGGNGQARMVVVESGDDILVWPYLLRQVAGVGGIEQTSATDVGSVYGYAGPLTNLGANAGFLDQGWAETEAIWHRQNAVSAFTRFHPILENQRLFPSAAIHQVGSTVSIDLRLTDEETMEAYPRVLRQEILAGRRAGLSTVEDQGWTALPTFVEIYHETMTRNHADGGYFFTAEELMRLRLSLGDSARLLVTRVEDEIAAAGIFLFYGQVVHAHLVGTASRFRELSPLKVLLDDARAWAAAAGAVRLHLGGGRGGSNDSLMTFKGRFSRNRHPFAVGRWLLDRAVYEDLCRRRAAHLGGQPRDRDFFPAYRAPAAESHPLAVEAEMSA